MGLWIERCGLLIPRRRYVLPELVPTTTATHTPLLGVVSQCNISSTACPVRHTNYPLYVKPQPRGGRFHLRRMMKTSSCESTQI